MTDPRLMPLARSPKYGGQLFQVGGKSDGRKENLLLSIETMFFCTRTLRRAHNVGEKTGKRNSGGLP